MGRPICAAAILAMLALVGCGSGKATTTAAASSSGQGVTSTAASTAPTAATATDRRCASTVPRSLAPPSGQWPTSTGYLVYSRTANAASAVLHGSERVAAARAAHDYRKAASQPLGSANNPYSVARAALDLEAVAHAAASTACPPAPTRFVASRSTLAAPSAGPPTRHPAAEGTCRPSEAAFRKPRCNRSHRGRPAERTRARPAQTGRGPRHRVGDEVIAPMGGCRRPIAVRSRRTAAFTVRAHEVARVARSRTRPRARQVTSLCSLSVRELRRLADARVSRRGESHPPALAEPDVNLSAHPAPIVQPSGRAPNRQCANRPGSRLKTAARSLRALAG